MLTQAAEEDFLNAHRRDLINLFVREYHAHGGPLVDANELAFMIKLSVAVLGIAWILDAPSLVENEIPDLHTVKDRFDPKLKDNFLARAQLQLLVVLLNEWQDDNIGDALREFAAGNAVVA